MRVMGIVMFAALAACSGDEGVRAYGAADKVWHLTQIDGADFGADATLIFPKAGRVTGRAPCNSWSAPQTAPYPWFDLGPVAATKMACPDLAAEQRFFDHLAKMSISEVSGDVLVLSNDQGGEMIFTARSESPADP
ncbi:META domain-containing protein [Tropicibacter sp. R15_0]|uniref:META domain-containing protein n=1 Tax=Tropicibacter sp. R15_0 TaxID=2821101 RepID=UPI001ADB1C5A|nr:META domain-containing protein [Tropicibacter sp. R15_0]MBO9468440.1 META domain-containing protein [Tropicibacter sp. R15_0]